MLKSVHWSACIFMAMGGCCSSAILEVGPDRPYQTICLALEACSAQDTILVDPGIYVEPPLRLKAGMTLRGAGSSKTVIAYDPPRSHGFIVLAADGAVIQQCWLVGAPGFAVMGLGGTAFDLKNCTFWGNAGAVGSSYTGWRAVLTNCTISENINGIVCGTGSSAVVRNTIVYGNSHNVLGDISDVSASYSNIQGGWPGEANINADPMFVNGEQLPDNHWDLVWPRQVEAIRTDFRLRADSPCIDAGLNSPDLPEFDIAGMHRIMFGGKSLTVDMGAHEFYINKLEPVPGSNDTTFTWSSLEGKTYSIFYTDDLFNWHTAIANFPSSGNQITSWTDDGSLTGLPPLLAPRRFYRLLENP